MKGSFREQNSITECALIFDGERFIIEKVALSALGLRESDEDREKESKAAPPKKRPRMFITSSDNDVNSNDSLVQNKKVKPSERHVLNGAGKGLASKSPRLNVVHQPIVQEVQHDNSTQLNSSFDDSDSDSDSSSSSSE